MATPSREAIETFISFTGASEAIAVQKLQAHGADDLNAAVNAYFNEGDRSSSINAHQTSVYGEHDFMAIGDPVDVGNLRPGLFGYASDFTNSAPPIVTRPREVREIPIEFRDGSRPSGQSDHLPKIEDVTGTVDDHGPEVHGTVEIVDDKEDEEPSLASIAHGPELEHPDIASNISRGRSAVYGAFESGGFQDTDDIEEEMIRAAIEASKKDVMQAYPSDPLTSHTDLTNHRTQEHLSHLSEFESSPSPSFIKLVSDIPEQGQNFGRSIIETSKLTEVEPSKVAKLSGSDELAFEKPRMQTGSTTAPDEAEIDESLASSPKHPYTSNNPQHNGNLFHAATVREKKRQREEKSCLKLDDEKELERHLAEIEASLPSEPRSDDENVVTLLVCMLDGSRPGRRFLRSDKLQCLFDFIDIRRVVKPGSYRLVRTYPAKAFGDGESSLTLNELELNRKEETLYLDLINGPANTIAVQNRRK